jgi:hypothetical protein
MEESTEERSNWEWYNTNVTKYRPLDSGVVRELVKGWVPSRLTDYYPVEGSPAITFVSAIRDGDDTVVGLLAAEIDLGFIQRVIDSAELGRNGDVLVVDTKGAIIFSTPGFHELSDVEEFNRRFPTNQAYQNKKGGVEYFGPNPKLAAYTRIVEMTRKPLMAAPFQFPFTTSITPREIPDWLIVVLQDSSDGYLVANRLKWNIIILLVIGAVGVFIIGKLWVDSLS